MTCNGCGKSYKPCKPRSELAQQRHAGYCCDCLDKFSPWIDSDLPVAEGVRRAIEYGKTCGPTWDVTSGVPYDHGDHGEES